MPNVLQITVENPEDLLNAGAYGAGALIRVQSAASQAGAFSDVAGTGSTPTLPIVAGTRSYTGFDPAGGSTTWYRTRYENVGNTRQSDWSPVFQVGAGGYTNLYDVKQDLELGSTPTSTDELLLDYIDEITDFIRAETRREFLPTTGVTLLFDGSDAIDGRRTLLVPGGVRSLTSIEVAATTGAVFDTVPLTDILLLPREQDRTPGWPATRLRFSDVIAGPYSSFPAGYANVRAVLDGGFAAVPPRVEGVARRTVVRMYNARQAGQSDMVGSGGEGGTPTVSMFLSKRDRETLEQLRIVRVHRAA